jgi:hypothetical protein
MQIPGGLTDQQAAFRLRENIRDLVDGCHRKVTAFLTDNCRWIFLPIFESARMVARAGRKSGRRTAGVMLTWAHYRFRQFLKFQSKKNNVVGVEVAEAYTSQTCIRCGHIHTRSGGAKVFGCPRCNQYAATGLARCSGCSVQRKCIRSYRQAKARPAGRAGRAVAGYLVRDFSFFMMSEIRWRSMDESQSTTLPVHSSPVAPRT